MKIRDHDKLTSSKRVGSGPAVLKSAGYQPEGAASSPSVVENGAPANGFPEHSFTEIPADLAGAKSLQITSGQGISFMKAPDYEQETAIRRRTTSPRKKDSRDSEVGTQKSEVGSRK